MNPSIKKVRIISFRISDQQYDRLCQASRVEGARSVSEYVRYLTLTSLAMEEAIHNAGIPTLLSRIEELHRRLDTFLSAPAGRQQM